MTNPSYATKTMQKSLGQRLKKDLESNYELYLIILPLVAFYLLFHYSPMYGAVIAFKDFHPTDGILGSSWVGLKHFREFFDGFYFWRLFRNTITISVATLVVGFPAPIALAILINEIRHPRYAKTVQTISYLPHFISMVVVCGMIKNFVDENGFINDIIVFLGGERSNLLFKKELFVPIYSLTNVWQEAGWGSIIYLAALTNIDPQLYEAAEVDGAGRFHKIWNITLPGILPTIVIMLILRVGNMMNVGYEKIILLYNGLTYETADVISSYVYREGLQNANWSISAAIGLFNSVINFILLMSANLINKKCNDTYLW